MHLAEPGPAMVEIAACDDRTAAEWPAHFVAFDLLRLGGTDTTPWSYRRRRAALLDVFAEQGLAAPWALCPSTPPRQKL
ncbi:hypothetical protein GCM10010365_72680 [Streptomyces poonensis]|uniref:ATP-dependent DNA ligase n=1 Tax=Streptomyces poonensis TaxID=68255 RepID=A0A918QCE1_9ACTN|nr:hypothetical protein GCM10010365_72680 [Streptomyces poonensis]